ncbi:hypothetical protein AB0945_33440 [Streptomyces sp. NPDC005474]|uniref:hypothetical protein n=1 Tax=Streptomyces sp. NPDC005474 TaxID=3154878 RepID=UPI003452758F
MNDTPGWASPGSAPSEGQQPGASAPADRPDPAEPADQPPHDPASPGPNWSQKQPPPAQWSAPTSAQGPGQAPPPPPPPGPGWGGTSPGAPGGYGGYGPPGGHPGWGGNWGGPPPAAKPGVIPLRPLGVGEILDGAVSTMRAHWRTVLGISLTVAVVTEIVAVLLQGYVLNNSTSADALKNPSASLDELTRAMGDALLSSGVLFVISLIGTVIATALLTTVTSRAVLGKTVTTGEAWRDARPQVPKLFGLILLLLLTVIAIMAVGIAPGLLVALSASEGGGAALAILGVFGASVVALWLIIRFSLASPALMLEKQSIVKSITRSAKLVRGAWWRVLGIQLLAGIIAGIVSGIVVVPFTFIGAALAGNGISDLFNGTGGYSWTFLIVSGIGSVLGSTLTLPITAGVTVLLYIDQRIRREALDLDLARAAGVQDNGSGTPGATPGS